MTGPSITETMILSLSPNVGASFGIIPPATATDLLILFLILWSLAILCCFSFTQLKQNTQIQLLSAINFICYLLEEHLSHSFSFSFLCFTSNLLWFMEGHFTRTLIRALMVYSKMFLPLPTRPLLVHWTSMAVCCGCGVLSAEVVEPPSPKPCEVFVCNYLVLAAVMEKERKGHATPILPWIFPWRTTDEDSEVCNSCFKLCIFIC